MKQTVLSYAAGIFDVRGSIRINIITYDNYGIGEYNPIVRLVVPNIKIDVLQYLKSRFGGCISRADKDRMYWQCSCRRAFKFCKEVLPYMNNKKKADDCRAIIRFYAP